MGKMDPGILDRCLRDIQSGEATLDRCLAENPSSAEALEPLLRVAASTRAQLAPAGPSQAFLTHSPKRVMNLAKARLKTSTPSRRRPPVWLRQPAYRMAGVLLALALLMGSVGIAYASGDALPGDNLYGVKRGLERAALVVSLSAQGDAELVLKHAGRRIAEVEELVRRGRGNDIGPALEGYEHAVRKGLEIADDHGAGLGNLGTALSNHEQALVALLKKAPEQAIPAINRALEHSQNGKKKVEQIREEQHPSESAPGQSQKTSEAAATELAPGQLKKTEAPVHVLPPGPRKKTETQTP